MMHSCFASGHTSAWPGLSSNRAVSKALCMNLADSRLDYVSELKSRLSRDKQRLWFPGERV